MIVSALYYNYLRMEIALERKGLNPTSSFHTVYCAITFPLHTVLAIKKFFRQIKAKSAYFCMKITL